MSQRVRAFQRCQVKAFIFEEQDYRKITKKDNKNHKQLHSNNDPNKNKDRLTSCAFYKGTKSLKELL